MSLCTGLSSPPRPRGRSERVRFRRREVQSFSEMGPHPGARLRPTVGGRRPSSRRTRRPAPSTTGGAPGRKGRSGDPPDCSRGRRAGGPTSLFHRVPSRPRWADGWDRHTSWGRVDGGRRGPKGGRSPRRRTSSSLEWWCCPNVRPLPLRRRRHRLFLRQSSRRSTPLEWS